MNRIGRLVLSFYLLCAGLACAHQTVQLPEGKGVFPFGTYQHEVLIHIFRPERKMELRGIVSYQKERLKVIGLALPLNTTVFRISENLTTGEVDKELFVEAIKNHEAQFMSFYRVIRELIMAPKGALEFNRNGVNFTLHEPDEFAVPRKVRIRHAQFALTVEVTSYGP